MFEPLEGFVREQSSYTDIFCLQEVFPCAATPRKVVGNVRTKLFSDFKRILADFNGYHIQASEVDVGGLATFVKKSLEVKKTDHISIFESPDPMIDEADERYFSMGRDLQRVEFESMGKTFSILNFHGMWTGKGKRDTDNRITQSHRVRKVFDESEGGRILCGDLNLEPDTESMTILNRGNRNLIEEYGITSTRSPAYGGPVKLADYVIASPEVGVKSFNVMSEVVSDHLPLCLEFN